MNEPSKVNQTTRERLWTSLRKAVPFTSGVVVSLAALFLYNTFVSGPQQLTANEVNNLVAQAMASATPPPAFSTRVYQVIQPSLVLIQAQVTNGDGKSGEKIGSGVVITDLGDILTSLHVVDEAGEITLTFADGTRSEALIVATQPENDIAVLRAFETPAQLIPATLGNPNAMQVGDEAFAVGNPFGLYASMSAGVVSGFDRFFRVPNSDQLLEGLIQVDAAVNPGNSGGPLLNRYGQVIGIVVGIVNPTEDEFFVGIGFAVPIQTAASAIGSPPY